MSSPFQKKFSAKSPLPQKIDTRTGEVKTEQLETVDLGVVKSKPKSTNIPNPYYGLNPKYIYLSGGGGMRMSGTNDAGIVHHKTLQPGKVKALKKKYRIDSMAKLY